MGTKVQSKSYLPGYYSMRDLNHDSNSCSWPLYYGDKTSTNGQYCNGFFPRAIADTYPGYDKDALKRKMLEHEAIFRKQVSELHRLYRIQKDLMDEIKKKQLPKNQVPIGPSLSSIPLALQITTEDAHKWHIPSFPVANSNCARPLVSGVEHSHSPLSFMKGSSIQAGSFLSEDGENSNDVEVLECRPTKVRRKTFDLELPADEYIDTEEAAQFKDETAPGMSRHLPRENGKIGPESGEKLFLGDVGNIGCLGDTSRPDTCLRGKNSLADLNEPIQIEETNGSAYSDCQDPNYGGREPSMKPKQELLGLSKEISSRRQRDNWSLNNVHVESNGNARGFFPHVLEAGHCTANLISTQGFQSEKLPVSSQQVHVLFDKAHDFPTFSQTCQNKVELSRERMLHSLEVTERNCEISNKSHPDSIMTSNVHSLNPFASYAVGKQWSHPVSLLEKPSSNLSQKSMSVQTRPFWNSSGSFSKSSMMAPQSNGIFGEKWQVSCYSKLSPGSGGELPNRNGCYHGSSSGSKEPAICFPSISYDYPKCSKGVFEHFTTHGSTKLYNCSNCVNTKSRTDMNLNVLLSNGSSTEPVLQQGHQIDGGRQHADHLPGLPWLRAKPACKNEATSEGRDLNVGELSFSQSSTKQSTIKNEIGNGFNQILTPNVKSVPFSNDSNGSRSEISECLHNKMILGTPIFENCYVSKNESSFTSPFVSVPEPSKGEAENKGRNRLLDINLPCDATVLDVGQDTVAENSTIENEADGKLSSFRSEIDLNSCVDENEASFTPSVLNISMKMAGGIDLEAPQAPEPEDVIHGEELLERARELPLGSVQSKDDCLQDELIKSAAEAIVVISSSGLCSHSDDVNCNSSETSDIDTLNWFVETISSFGEDLESKLEALLSVRDGDQDESCVEEIDYFESMILELAETKEEDFMPKPLVPENFKVEETGTTALLTTRTRKGQGRRGRQRRDFRRDILPGLASLSRHEVTEDLQTFGWLMRATGHSWQSGLTRRNGTRSRCGRRRRLPVTANSSPSLVAATTSTALVQQLNNIKVGSEDRSLTGWGKTTRRPRRQRCPAGGSSTSCNNLVMRTGF